MTTTENVVISFFQILWKSRCDILVAFPSHLKKLRFILRYWLEKLNCEFFHLFHSWKNTTKQLFQSKFQCRKCHFFDRNLHFSLHFNSLCKHLAPRKIDSLSPHLAKMMWLRWNEGAAVKKMAQSGFFPLPHPFCFFSWPQL